MVTYFGLKYYCLWPKERFGARYSKYFLLAYIKWIRLGFVANLLLKSLIEINKLPEFSDTIPEFGKIPLSGKFIN